MLATIDRVLRAAGTPYAIGRALGQRIGPCLSDIIDTYIEQGPAAYDGVDNARLAAETQGWFETLPDRYRQEMTGLAAGAGIPVCRVAEWTYVEACTPHGCSSVLLAVGGRTWVARNNDIWVPALWGYVTIRDHVQRIPTLSIGMPGESFTATGVNRARLWLHYHYMPTPQGVEPPVDAWFEFQWMTEALETCGSVGELVVWLDRQPRRGSMLLFVIDGKTDERAVFECLPATHRRWPDDQPFLVATNHSLFATAGGCTDSHRRYAALRLGLRRLAAPPTDDPVAILRTLLADPSVEQRRGSYGTVYSTIACPAAGSVWVTLGGYPAASGGTWQQIAWPWTDAD